MLKVFNDVEFGCVYGMLYPELQGGTGSILEKAGKIVEDPDFTCIELSWVKDDATRKELSRILATGQMEVVYSQGLPAYAESLDLNSLDDQDRRRSVARSKELIDEARELGASVFQVIGGPDPGENDRDKAKKYLADSLMELAEYAKEEPEVKITLENMDRDVDKKFLTGPTEESVSLIKNVRKEFSNVGLTLDLAHLPLLNEDPSAAAKEAKSVVCHVHLGNSVKKVKDHPRFGDTHPRIGIDEGEIGITELKNFLVTLKEIGFLDSSNTDILDKNILSFEVMTAKDQSPEVILAATKRAIRRAAFRV